MVKLADTPDLGSGAERLGGSSPSQGTILMGSWCNGNTDVLHASFGGSNPSLPTKPPSSTMVRIQPFQGWELGSTPSGGAIFARVTQLVRVHA